MLKKGLDPILNGETKIIILGSLPSDKSIAKQEYYANKSNDFWKLLSKLYNIDFENSSYPEKKILLLSKKIGLWDVYHAAWREGSMDHMMTKKVFNDFNSIKQIAPNNTYIFFNGKEAGLAENILKNLGYQTLVLPSSSGANRKNQEARLLAWEIIRTKTQ